MINCGWEGNDDIGARKGKRKEGSLGGCVGGGWEVYCNGDELLGVVSD